MTAGSLAASGTPSAVAGTLSKLPAHTVIYYRASATNAFGTTNGSLQKFTTAAAPAPPAAPTHATTAQFGNQQLTLTTPPLQTCTAKTATITAMVSSTAIPQSHAAKLRFVSAAFYLGKGLGHPRKKTKRLRNGKHKTVTVVVYTANTVVHHLPATSTLGLDGLHSGSHTLKVKISYHETVTKHQRKSTLTVTKTLSAKFRVCWQSPGPSAESVRNLTLSRCDASGHTRARRPHRQIRPRLCSRCVRDHSEREAHPPSLRGDRWRPDSVCAGQ